jgi:hypothetical protein
MYAFFTATRETSIFFADNLHLQSIFIHNSHKLPSPHTICFSLSLYLLLHQTENIYQYFKFSHPDVPLQIDCLCNLNIFLHFLRKKIFTQISQILLYLLRLTIFI